MSANRMLSGLSAGMGGMALALLVLATVVSDAQASITAQCKRCRGREYSKMARDARGECRHPNGTLDEDCAKARSEQLCATVCAETSDTGPAKGNCQGENEVLNFECENHATGTCTTGSWGYICDNDNNVCYDKQVIDPEGQYISSCFATCECGASGPQGCRTMNP